MKKSKWVKLAEEACEDAGLDAENIEIITTWDQTFSDNDLFRHNAVFRVGERNILKLYGTDAIRHSRVESTILQALHDVVPTPRLVATGNLENSRPYIIMTEVQGQTLQEIWPSLSRSALLNIAHQIGNITADLHRYPVDSLKAVEKYEGGRLQIIAEEQARRTAEILTMDDLSGPHRDELLEFTQTEALEVLNYPVVLTHADLSHAHIYIVALGNNEPYVSGFIDWAEAMIGPKEWDLAFHWLWTFSGDKEAMAKFLDAYYGGKSRPKNLARRCFSAHYFTFSMSEVWDYIKNIPNNPDSFVLAMISELFPPDVFH